MIETGGALLSIPFIVMERVEEPLRRPTSAWWTDSHARPCSRPSVNSISKKRMLAATLLSVLNAPMTSPASITWKCVPARRRSNSTGMPRRLASSTSTRASRARFIVCDSVPSGNEVPRPGGRSG